MPTPALVFDLDGTLVDTRHDLAAAVNGVMREEGLGEVGLDTFGHLYGVGARPLLAKALLENGIADPDPAEIERLFLRFIALYRADIAGLSLPFPGILDLLVAFRAEGWRLAVCTNKSEPIARQLLEHLKMLDLFDALVGGDTFARSKPDAMPVLGAIERAGARLAGSVMIGDSRADIDAARAAGIPVVAVTFGYTAVPVRELSPDAVIDHFDELRSALDRIGIGLDLAVG